MTTPLTIDFVSDIACPWCAVGLGALEQALQRLEGEVSVELRFQPFELNPQMGPGGQDLGEHLTERSLDHGIVRTMWMSPAEVQASVAQHRSPLVWQCVRDHQAGMRLPLSALHTDASVHTLQNTPRG